MKNWLAIGKVNIVSVLTINGEFVLSGMVTNPGRLKLWITTKENNMKRAARKVKVAAVKASHLKKRAKKTAARKVAKAKHTIVKA